ncbi:hypothetical protein ABEB36_000342 [Hypothenemus hampei]|uniref:Regulatory protein zeste n=1 Tax=Hypothenemus hampei TaxID=57062 RepID=A0ABD1FAV7_HYPHA
MSAKTRVPNFTTKESLCLLDLVDRYKSVLECKKSDTFANKQKKETPVDVLKNKYANCKRMAKRRNADEKMYIGGTGGGPPIDIRKPNDEDLKIKNIIGSQLTGRESQFDSDAIANAEVIIEGVYDIQETETEDVEKIEDTNVKILPNNDQAQNSNHNWKNYTPGDLKTPKSTHLKVKHHKDGIANKIVKWTEKKAEKEELEKVMSKEIFELNKTQRQKLFEIELKCAEEKLKQIIEENAMKNTELKRKLEMLEEEHDLKMKILRKK